MLRVTAASVANSSRIHPLESLRGSLMILGVLAHAILVVPYFLPNADGSLGWLYQAIHVFRLPTYFLIAGFFAAWLLQRSGVLGFLVSRFKRLTSVLIVAQLVMWFTFSHDGCAVCVPLSGRDWLGHGWLYLWFLYYLVLFSHIAVAIFWAGSRFSPTALAGVSSWLERRKLSWLWAMPVVAVGGILPAVFNSQATAILDEGVIPNSGLMMFYGTFFAFGWLVHATHSWHVLAKGLWGYAYATAAIGMLLGTGTLAAGNPLFALGASALAWVATLLVIAIAFRFGEKPSKLWRYLDDASYWTYLWHLPVLLMFAAFLKRWVSNPVALTAACFGLALSFCILSYHLLVRFTIVGLWLSGRRRPRRSNRRSNNS